LEPKPEIVFVGDVADGAGLQGDDEDAVDDGLAVGDGGLVQGAELDAVDRVALGRLHDGAGR
jgi:hypothetical protein